MPWSARQSSPSRPSGRRSPPPPPEIERPPLNKQEGFEPNETDRQIAAAHGTRMTRHFHTDRQGIIPWAHVEAPERPEDLLQFPSEEEILRAARSLSSPIFVRSPLWPPAAMTTSCAPDAG